MMEMKMRSRRRLTLAQKRTEELSALPTVSLLGKMHLDPEATALCHPPLRSAKDLPECWA